MLLGGTLLVAVSLVAQEPLALPTQSDTLLAMAYLIGPGSIGVFMLALYVLARWTASATSYAFLLFPLVAIVLGAVLFAEPVQPSFLLGGALCWSGVYVGAIYRPRVAAAERRPKRQGARDLDEGVEHDDVEVWQGPGRRDGCGATPEWPDEDLATVIAESAAVAHSPLPGRPLAGDVFVHASVDAAESAGVTGTDPVEMDRVRVIRRHFHEKAVADTKVGCLDHRVRQRQLALAAKARFRRDGSLHIRQDRRQVRLVVKQ